MNRPRWEGGKGRFAKKILGKNNWFKKRRIQEGSKGVQKESGRKDKECYESERDETEPETVLFLPSTP